MLNKIVVIGAGTMGQGIAQWFLQQNVSVELVDLNQDFLKKSGEKIFQSFDKLQSNGKLQALDVTNFKNNLTLKSLENISLDCDLVIEAIIEKLDHKLELFKNLDQKLSKKTIIASNTSSFPITELASVLTTERKKNFLGLHFFNPATIMKLVEVINGLETDKDLAHKLALWFNSKGKVACLCADAPGFIVNRVARNFYGESLRALETYDEARAREIDTVMREVGGFKMGPFELMDLIGIDVNFSVTESVYRAFFDEARFKPHRLQKEMVNAHRLGKKTGKGFYVYES